MVSTIDRLVDGPQNHVIHVEGTVAVAAEIIINVSDLSTVDGRPCTSVRLDRLTYDSDVTSAVLLWDASANTRAWGFGPGTSDSLSWKDFGGLQNNAGSGKTGDVLLTVVVSAGTHYSFTLECTKKYN